MPIKHFQMRLVLLAVAAVVVAGLPHSAVQAKMDPPTVPDQE
jgi:hypothetical protein